MAPPLTHTVAVKSRGLTDGSTVYSVEISEYGPHETSKRMTFEAMDKAAAFALADSLAATLNGPWLAFANAETRDHTYDGD